MNLRRLRILILLAVILVIVILHGRGHSQVGTIVPTPSPLPSPSPTPINLTITRMFMCNCTSAGQPVLWSGTVQATGYFQARQMATSQCLAYLGEKPVSPMIPTPAAANVATTPTLIPLVTNVCGLCSCN
jgi:hypothetical protein